MDTRAKFVDLSARLAFFDEDQDTDIMVDLTHLVTTARVEKWSAKQLQQELKDFVEIISPAIDDEDHLEVFLVVVDCIPDLLGL